jgi:hypothetical protein
LDLHVGAFNPVSDLLSEPRRVMVTDYNAQYLSSVGVEIQFEAGRAYCYVIARQLTLCQASDTYLADSFRCLLVGSEPDGDECRADATAEVQAWLTQSEPSLGDSPEIEVTGRMGGVSLLSGRGRDGRPFACRVYGIMPMLFSDCAFSQTP